MSLPNPDIKFAKSKGVDLPLLYIYLAGKIQGSCINKCLLWRKQIIDYYSDYQGKGAYPVVFLDALNSKEADSIDKLGLTSALPPKFIYSKDMLSVKKADAVIANVDDYFEADIEDLLRPQLNQDNLNHMREFNSKDFDIKLNVPKIDFEKAFFRLQEAIKNRRSNWGTICEVSWALWLQKPVILIAGNKTQKEMLEKHPFMRESSIIVESVDELLEKKWINILYKSISSAIY